MVAGHVTLDISCTGRLYLNGYVPRLQTAGGIICFFHEHRKNPVVSPALFEPIGAKFRKEMKDWAKANGIPLAGFKSGERKADVMAPYLDAAAATGRSQVAAVGCAQEFQGVWTARKRDTDPGKPPQFSFTREQRRVSVFYVYPGHGRCWWRQIFCQASVRTERRICSISSKCSWVQISGGAS
jgi:hypothetical protein